MKKLKQEEDLGCYIGYNDPELLMFNHLTQTL